MAYYRLLKSSTLESLGDQSLASAHDLASHDHGFLSHLGHELAELTLKTKAGIRQSYYGVVLEHVIHKALGPGYYAGDDLDDTPGKF